MKPCIVCRKPVEPIYVDLCRACGRSLYRWLPGQRGWRVVIGWAVDRARRALIEELTISAAAATRARLRRPPRKTKTDALKKGKR
jgi:hypothetical protein